MGRLSKSADKFLFEIGRFVLSKPWISSILLLMLVTFTVFSNKIFTSSSPPLPNTTFSLLIPPVQQLPAQQNPIISGNTIPSPPVILSSIKPTDTVIEKNSQWKTVTVTKGDNLARIFKHQHLKQKDLQSIVDLGSSIRPLTHLQPGETIRLLVSADGQLQQLEYPMTDKKTVLTLTRAKQGFRFGKGSLPILATTVTPSKAPSTSVQQNVASTPTKLDPNKNTLVLAQGDWQTLTIRSGDTLAKIFKKHQLSSKDLAMIAASSNARALRHLTVGQEMRLLIDANHKLQQLVYAINDKKILTVHPATRGFQIIVNAGTLPENNKILAITDSSKTNLATTPPPQSKVTPADKEKYSTSSLIYAAGEINKSLYQDARKIGLSVKQANQLAQVFGTGTMAKNMRAGDHFSVLYEERKKNSTGNIVAAQLSHQGKNYQVVRFTDPKGHSQFYTPTGESLQEGILRTPLNYTHVSSHFTTRRLHPMLRFVRPHLGVDFAAPSGTPIKAAGNGTITLMGYKGGFGKTVLIKHDAQYTTLYGHLSRFPKKLRVGATVQKGDVIGYVGSTGIATGSHLHYEIHVNNIPKDPLKVALPGASIPKIYRTKFLAQTKTLLAQLNLSRRVKLAERENSVKTKKS